jgi:predicted DNA-binding transcriptional regulator YafY
MQINRMLEIVYILLRQKIVTAKTLSEEFGVSQRTIYRDIDALSLAGIPVYTEKGKGGGIGLLPEFVLDKSILNGHEQQEILSALQALSSVNPAETSNIFKKLTALFNKSSANWLQVDFTGWSSKNNIFFNDFKTAIIERLIVEFDYYNSYSEKTRRRIEPVQLWFKGKAWYIIGFCLKRQGVRVFRLTRINNLRITNKNFSARSLPSVYDETGEDEQRNPIITLKLKIEPEMTYRILDEFEEEAVKKQPDGSFIVIVKWPESNWVYSFILSFGEYIEVLEPKRIRKTIKKILLNINKKYL